MLIICSFSEFVPERNSSRFSVIRPKALPNVRGLAMQENSTEYVCLVNFDSRLPDEHAWREKLFEMFSDWGRNHKVLGAG